MQLVGSLRVGVTPNLPFGVHALATFTHTGLR